MSENVSVQHRLLGKEDLYLDTNNTDASTTVESPWGDELPLTALNASGIPLSALSASATGAKTVSDAIVKLNTRIDEIEDETAQTGPTDGLTINVTSLTTSAIYGYQTQIATWAPRGVMNGFTLTLKLTENQAFVAQGPFSLEDMHAGRIVIDLNGATVTKSAGASSGQLACVFSFTNCTCPCEVKGGSIAHTGVDYGVIFDNCSSGEVNGVTFSSSSASTRYGIEALGCPVEISGCSFTSDGTVYFGDVKSTGTWTADGSRVLFNELSGQIEDLEDSVDDLEEQMTGMGDYICEVGHWEDTNGVDKMDWRVYKNGIMEIYGVSSINTYDTQGYVHKIDFEEQTEKVFSDTNYTIVLSPCQTGDVRLTLDSSGNVTDVDVGDTTGRNNWVALAPESTTTGRFYVLCKSGLSTSEYQQRISWHLIGTEGTAEEE